MIELRDYDQEGRDVVGRKYAYRFDIDVMHPLMLRSFEPFIQGTRALELGSYQGAFTHRLLERFTDLTCVEASAEAISVAKTQIGSRAHIIEGHFEDVALVGQYDSIILTHVLEHLDDPVKVLKRINQEWLSRDGRLFLVCPNANAPSRQIAVHMGLISHNAGITEAERKHGHRITYSLDTLERDINSSGLEVLHRSGIFFKALANFQWDQLLGTDIISSEYIEGCFKLGHRYPELCSSIFFVCQRGRFPEN